MGKVGSQKQCIANRSKRKGKKRPSWEIANPHAGGLDLASQSHFAAIGHGNPDEDVREFGATTNELKKMAEWFLANQVKTVAMEATGVYWIPSAQILERAGIEVVLVHPAHVKAISGKKTDVMDSQWLQQLHTYGMLRGAFRPNDKAGILRSYMRRRDSLVRLSTTHILHMQKALDQMNVLVHRAVTDITGKTGMKIIKAILNGQTDPIQLGSLRHSRCKLSAREMAEALNGNFRQEHLFSLQQALAQYEFCQNQIVECDKEIEKLLLQFQPLVPKENVELPSLKAKPRSRNEFHFEGQKMAVSLVGIDLTDIDGFRAGTVLKILAETGWTLEEFSNSKKFCSWLALCPGNNRSGGKNKSGRTRKSASRAAEAFRMAAQSVRRVDSPLGDFYRKMKARLGPAQAVTATAHKMARIFYKLVTEKVVYDPVKLRPNPQKERQKKLNNLLKQARTLGMTLVDEDGVLYP